MRFVNASYQRLEIPDANDKSAVYQHLERIGRVCYKSEDKITDDSAIHYLETVRNSRHWAMLEHFIFVMSISAEDYDSIQNAAAEFPTDFNLHNKLKFIDATKQEGVFRGEDVLKKYLVSGSATSFNYLWECKSMMDNPDHVIVKICEFLNSKFPDIMRVPDGYELQHSPRTNYFYLLKREEIESLPRYLRMIHDSMSVTYVTNLGVSHDMVRSRPASWAMESTRWVNYSKKCGYTYTIPLWFSPEERELLLNEDYLNDFIATGNPDPRLSSTTQDWVRHLKAVETTYDYFAKEFGYRQDQISLLLPKNFKTELTMTARLAEWKHFFFLRVDKRVRPDMLTIVGPLFKECLERDPEIYDDQTDLLQYLEYIPK